MADSPGALAFDPTTAKPVEDTGSFDPTTARPVDAGPSAQPGAGSTGIPKRAYMAEPPLDRSGLPFMDRVHLQMADNDDERELYLKNRYGKGNVGKAVGPTGKPVLWVKINGKKFAADAGGQFMPSLIGDAPELTGMAGGGMMGAAYGSAVGPLGTLAGGIIGAGIGGMVGKGATEVGKVTTGDFDKGVGGTANVVGKAGLSGMAGEVGGRMLGPVVSRLTRGPLPKFLTDTTPEVAAMTDRVTTGGALPPAVSTMPGARKIQRIETLADKISGPSPRIQNANKGYLEGRVKGVLAKAGIPAEHTDAVLRELDSPTSALTTQKVGADVQEAVRAHVNMLEQGVESSLTAAKAATDSSLRHLNALSERYKPGDLGLDVAGGISKARSDFATASGKIYKQVDRLTGGRAIYPTALAAKEAQKLMTLIPESDAAGRAVVKQIADYPAFVTFEQAQRARTQLHDLMYSANLTPGATKHEFGKVADALDRGFDQAKKLAAGDFAPPSPVTSAEDSALLADFGISAGREAAPPNAGEMAEAARGAARMLEQADEFYGEGIKKFNDVTVNRLVASTRAGLPPDPSIIAKTIVQPGQEARVKEIRKLVGEDTFRRVMAADWQNMLGTVTAQDGTISGRKLYSEVTRRGKLMDTVYGPEEAARIRNLAETLSAMDGHIPAEKMQQGAAKELVATLEQSKKNLDSFMKENYLSALADPKKTPEDAYKWITAPGQGARLEAAARFFGEDSPQMQGIREAATRTLLDGTITRATSGDGSRALNNALKQYTEKQQKLLFPGGLDEDLKLLGREVEFLFPNKADQAMAGFSAGNILEMPWYKRWYHQGVGAGWRMLLTNRTMIRGLSIGLRGNGPAREAARHTIKQIAYFGALEMNDDDGGDDEQEPTTGAAGPGSGRNNPEPQRVAPDNPGN